MPAKILWAWERPEDLRFIDVDDYGVAFLAQTIFLENELVSPKARRQPLEVPPGTYMIAVTRIETSKDGRKRPTFDDEMVTKTASLIKSTLDLPDVRAIQVDFDAVASEREFYRMFMDKLAVEIKMMDVAAENTHHSPLIAHHSLTMTSLASWCTGDAWFNDFPVDEAVPMIFQMGADSDKIKTFLHNGNDWREPLCRGSYGISVDDPLGVEVKKNRRIYYFSGRAWREDDVERLR